MTALLATCRFARLCRCITARRAATALVVGAAAAAFPASASAGLIAYEGFDYTATDNFHGKSGGTGWAAASTWTASNSTRMKIASQGLSYLNLEVSGNAVWNL